MARQLSLLQPHRSWQLSESTREVNRRGVAEARKALQAAIAEQPTSAPHASAPAPAGRPGGRSHAA